MPMVVIMPGESLWNVAPGGKSRVRSTSIYIVARMWLLLVNTVTHSFHKYLLSNYYVPANRLGLPWWIFSWGRS